VLYRIDIIIMTIIFVTPQGEQNTEEDSEVCTYVCA